MRCPHCRERVPDDRRRSHGGQCPACRRLFVTGPRVAYTDLSPQFLRERVAALGRDGALRVTSLQLRWDARERRPYPLYPPTPWWHIGSDLSTATIVTAVALLVVGFVAAAVHWSWSSDAIVSAGIGAVMTAPVTIVALSYILHALAHVPVILVRLPVRLVRKLIPDRRRTALTPSGFAALARTAAADVVDEHGMAPPPAPRPVRFAVLCSDPAVAACLWANDVGARLGALVVMATEDVPRRVPVLQLPDLTPADSPGTVMTAVLRFGRDHLDTGRAGFLTWPESG